MKAHLIEAGFPEDKITVIPDEEEAVAYILTRAQRGDLVLVFGDKISRCWKQIIRFKELCDDSSTSAGDVASTSLDGGVKVDLELLKLDDGLISDERGVRLPRELSD